MSENLSRINLLDVRVRAKRASDGQWVEGYYVRINGYHCVVEDKKQSEFVEYVYFIDGSFTPVNLVTVCRFTGKYDKNGKPVWEHDILRDIESGLYLVLYSPAEMSFVLRQDGIDWHIEDFEESIDTKTEYFEVIGNAFDNSGILIEEK